MPGALKQKALREDRRAFFSETVGIVGVRPYDGIRHSFASQLVNKGKSIEIIGKY